MQDYDSKLSVSALASQTPIVAQGPPTNEGLAKRLGSGDLSAFARGINPVPRTNSKKNSEGTFPAPSSDSAAFSS